MWALPIYNESRRVLASLLGRLYYPLYPSLILRHGLVVLNVHVPWNVAIQCRSWG